MHEPTSALCLPIAHQNTGFTLICKYAKYISLRKNIYPVLLILKPNSKFGAFQEVVRL